MIDRLRGFMTTAVRQASGFTFAGATTIAIPATTTKILTVCAGSVGAGLLSLPATGAASLFAVPFAYEAGKQFPGKVAEAVNRTEQAYRTHEMKNLKAPSISTIRNGIKIERLQIQRTETVEQDSELGAWEHTFFC